MKAFILDHHRGIGNQELADLINERFGTRYTRKQVQSYKKNHKLSSGLDGRFKKGAISVNKGRKASSFMSSEQLEKCKATQFRKGHAPHNKVPVGTEVIKDDGYLWRKIAEPNVWRQVHRLIYEQSHGSLPEDKFVTFLDGDRLNLDIGNLVLISKDENRILNKRGLRYPDKDLSMSGIALARLESTINSKLKGGR